MYIANNAVFTLHGNNSFINNSAEWHCGAIYTSKPLQKLEIYTPKKAASSSFSYCVSNVSGSMPTSRWHGRHLAEVNKKLNQGDSQDHSYS